MLLPHVILSVMSVSATDLLSQVENALSGLLVALANVNVQEYQMADGRQVKRADFPRTIKELRAARNQLQLEVAAQAGLRPRTTLVTLRRTSGTHRFG